LISTTGCTLVGYGTGHRIDQESRFELHPIRCDAPELEEGRFLRLTLVDGTEISGTLLESRCDPAQLIVRTERLNFPDSVDTFRVESIDRVEIQGKNVTSTLTGLGLLGDIGIAIVILQARGEIAGAMR
jgi:hypothetical protein